MDSSRSHFSCEKIQKIEVKHSVENLVLKSSSEDAEIAVSKVARQLYSAVETDEQDSEMSSMGYGKAQLIPFVVNERINKQVDMDDGEPQSMSHALWLVSLGYLQVYLLTQRKLSPMVSLGTWTRMRMWTSSWRC